MSQERQETVPPLFAALHSREIDEERRPKEFGDALNEVRQHLADLRYADSLAKFREALCLTCADATRRQKAFDFAVAEAQALLAENWRVAQALIDELPRLGPNLCAPENLLAEIERRRNTEIVANALGDFGESTDSSYLPCLRARVAKLAEEYSRDNRFAARLEALDQQLAEQIHANRQADLWRLTRFSQRLDVCQNPRVLRQFASLAAPFTEPHGNDQEFTAVVEEVADLSTKYDAAAAALAEDKTSECAVLCREALAARPGNTLFLALQEKNKAREWVAILAESSLQRAREFQQQGRLDAAIEELESLRQINPRYPGLQTEIVNCSALRRKAAEMNAAQLNPAARPEAVEAPAEPVPESIVEEPLPEAQHAAAEPYFLPEPVTRVERPGYRIAMTNETWNHFKTGLAAAMALMLAVLVLVLQMRRA